MTVRQHAAVLAAMLAFGALAIGLIRDPLVLDLTFFILIFAVLGTGWNWISGYAGQISFGHALFFGCGAYASAAVETAHGAPLAGAALGAVVAAALALAVGFPSFRLRGHYFSIATIALAAIAETIARNSEAIGGASGLELPIALGLGKAAAAFAALALFALVTALTIVAERRFIGFALRAIRSNEDAAASVGIDPRAVKLTAFAAGAVACALAGSLYAQETLFVDPESVLALSISIAIALVGVVGGTGTVWGPVLGAVVYVFLSKEVAALFGGAGRGIDLVLYGGLICLLAALRPDGLAGLARLVRARGPR